MSKQDINKKALAYLEEKGFNVDEVDNNEIQLCQDILLIKLLRKIKNEKEKAIFKRYHSVFY